MTRMMTITFIGGWLVFSTLSKVSAQDRTGSASAQAAGQRSFSTPEAAVDAMLEAFKNEDDKKLLDIFGREHEELIMVTDKVARREAFQQLCNAAKEARKLESQDDKTRILILGREAWPFPIPLVKDAAGWRFDTAAGKDEILNRRIGEGELEAIATCRIYFAAQLEYASEDRDGDEVLEYAQRMVSTPGKKDGLYWPVADDSAELLSPLGGEIADAAAYLEAGKAAKAPIPYHGYYFKILTRQGKNPPGGQYDYVINGNMIAGFALVACPADYGSSGIMTFVISHHGKVYEKDLGKDSLEIVKKMTEYDPDKTWTYLEED